MRNIDLVHFFLRIGWKPFWDYPNYIYFEFRKLCENVGSKQIKCDFAKAFASLWGSDTRSIKILTYYKMLQSCSTFCTFFSWQFFFRNRSILKNVGYVQAYSVQQVILLMDLYNRSQAEIHVCFVAEHKLSISSVAIVDFSFLLCDLQIHTY